jgi:hypothetical protein
MPEHDPTRFSRRDAAILAALVLWAIVVRVPFQFGAVQGEQDVARLITSALIWEQTGVRTTALAGYHYYTSPGYVALIRALLPVARDAGVPVVTYLNAINTVVAVVIVIPVFLLYRRLGGTAAAALGTVLLTLIPAFWVGGLYGFPSLPATLFLVVALWLFDRWLTDAERRRTSWASIRRLVPVMLCLTATLLLKADIYLSAIALWGLLLIRHRLTWRDAATLCVVGGVPVLALLGVSSAMLQASPDAARYMVQWRTEFTPDPADVWSREHLLQLAMSMGVLTLPLFALACVALARARRFALLATLVAWTVVPVGFWFVRAGDSARHHAQAALPASLGVGTLLALLPAGTVWPGAMLALIAGVNYVAFPASRETVTTSGNLAGSAPLIRRQVLRYQTAARDFADLELPRRAFVGTYTNPYAEHAVLARADRVLRVTPIAPLGFPGKAIEYLRGERRHLVATAEVPLERAREVAEAFRAAGFAVYAMQYEDGMRRQRASSRVPLLYAY